MNKSILDRYSRTANNAIIIEVTTDKVEDLYNNFDRSAPFIKKDLDDELTEYLVNAVGEIGNESFVILFRFALLPDPDLVVRLKDSIRNYFQYMKTLQTQKLAKMIRRSTIFLLSGLLLLALSIAVNSQTLNPQSIIINVFAQGLTIAAWVSMWEALANFLIRWAPYQKTRKIYNRIIKADLIFEPPPGQ